MKFKTSAIGIFMVLFMIQPVQAESACRHVTMEWIGSQIPVTPDATLVLKQVRGDTCEVVLAIDGGLAPVYAGKDFIVAGRMYKNGISVTRETLTNLSDIAAQERERAEEKKARASERRKEFFKSRFGELSPLVAISFSPENPKDFIYVITDPACSHCKDLLNRLEKIAIEAQLALKIIIYPFLEDNSWKMGRHAVCKGYSFAQYKGMEAGDVLTSCKKADQLIHKTYELMNRAGISFVPVVVASNGAWTVEQNDIREIRAHLGLENQNTGQGGGGNCGGAP